MLSLGDLGVIEGRLGGMHHTPDKGTGYWFWGFSRVLFTDLMQAKQICQLNRLSLVTVEEATDLFMQGREPSQA